MKYTFLARVECTIEVIADGHDLQHARYIAVQGIRRFYPAADVMFLKEPGGVTTSKIYKLPEDESA